jgi:uncharacterized protein YkwD
MLFHAAIGLHVDLRAPVHVKVQPADKLLVLLNQHRAAHGEQPVRYNSQLNAEAHWHVARLAAEGFPPDPHDLDGMSWVARIEQFGYRSWTDLGQNVADNWGYPDPVKHLDTQWWNSPEHRRNMLDPLFAEVGIAVLTAGGKTYGCVDFGRAA